MANTKARDRYRNAPFSAPTAAMVADAVHTLGGITATCRRCYVSQTAVKTWLKKGEPPSPHVWAVILSELYDNNPA